MAEILGKSFSPTKVAKQQTTSGGTIGGYYRPQAHTAVSYDAGGTKPTPYFSGSYAGGGNPSSVMYTGPQPTVTTNASVIEDKLPDMQARLQKMAAPSSNAQSSGSTGDSGGAEYDGDLGEEDANINSILQQMMQKNDDIARRQIGGISSMFDARRKQMIDIDMREGESVAQSLLMGGSSRYAQVSSGGILSEHERQSVMHLAELDAEEQRLIAAALSAQDAGDFQVLEKRLAMAEEKRAEKQAAAEKLSKDVSEENLKLRNQAMIYSAIKGGISDPMDIYGALEGQVSIDEVTGFLSKVTPKNEAGGFEFTPTQTAQILGTGLSAPQISQALDVVKQHGYPKLASMLTPQERKVFDGIFLPKDPKAVAGGTTGAGGFDQFAKEQIALSVVPVQLRNTEVELNRFLHGIRSGLEQGMTPYQVADTLMGYQIQNPDRFSEGMRQYMNLLPDLNGVQATARLINGGNQVGAITKLENEVLQNQKAVDPEGYVGEATTVYYFQKAREIDTLLSTTDFYRQLGPITGTLNNALIRYRGPKATEIRAKVTSLVSEMRNHLAGTAVTASERMFLEPLIPNLSDTLPSFKEKLVELPTNSLTKYNSVRTTAGLPPLDPVSLTNKNARVPLYFLSDAATGAINDPTDLMSAPVRTNAADPAGIF